MLVARKIISRDFIDDEVGPSRPVASKTASDTHEKRKEISDSRSYYFKDHRPVVRQIGACISQYHHQDNTFFEDDYNDAHFVTDASEDKVILSSMVTFHSLPVGPPHIGIRSLRPPNHISEKMTS